MTDQPPRAPMIDSTKDPEETAQAAPASAGRARIPVATYRLQFNSAFTFRAAAGLIEYLHHLGISDIYASPILRARGGSSHGYDICDPTQLNPALGSEEDFEAMVAGLQGRGMGLLLDTVPNHMGIGDPCNGWWLDVLENGPSSPYAPFFDIDWHPIKPEFQNKVLLPVLEDQYGAVLESGKLRLAFADGAFYIYYYDLRLPVAPGTYRIILEACLARLDRSKSGADASDAEDNTAPPMVVPVTEPGAAPGVAPGALPEDQEILELQSILTAVNHLPSRSETDRERVYERYREKEVIKRRLAALYNSDGAVKEAIDATLADFNGRPGDPHSFDLLDGLMDSQVYRLAFWRVAGEEINYRRFFDINDLAAVRVEVPEVFQATHQLILRLLQEGKATGLRIDHPDGLYDPATYFERLQKTYVELTGGSTEDPASPEPATHNKEDGSWTEQLPLYVVAEKILSEREPLPLDWSVHGTTGYDFLASANNLFVQTATRGLFDRIYAEFIGHQISLDELTIANKIVIMRESLSSEINALSHQLERIGERNRHYRDFTLNGITSALREVLACLPVYRTYINALTGEVPERDRKFVEMAVRAARRRRPGLSDAIFNFIQDTLLLRNIQDFAPADQVDLAVFVMKFQQLSGPVMAKGVEDTAFYIYNRLVSLNEVGNSPDQFGISVADFHRDNSRRAQRWPHSLLATSTHDNKRSEDVRARIDVLSEMPDAWRTALARWSRQNNAKKSMVDGRLAPDRNDEYLLYQTLLGAWPLAPDGGGEAGRQPGFAAVAEPGDPPGAGWSAETGSTPDGAAHDGARPGAADESAYLEPVPATADSGGSLAAGEGSEAMRPELWGFLLRPIPGEEFTDFRQRIVAYMQKAAKEAKVHTSWINPDAEYDQALQSFVERLLDPGNNGHFLNELAPLARQIAYYGQFNSLAQVLLKLTCPGVPDLYQGQELWDFSLVDPDNRRPVDYELRCRLLDELQEQVKQSPDGRLLDLDEGLLSHSHDGRIKLFVTAAALAFRQTHEDVFALGSYTPLAVDGSKADHICAFSRDLDEQRVVVVVPRLVVGLTGGIERPPMGSAVWDDAWLALPGEAPGTGYRSVYTGEVHQVAEHDGQPGLPLALVLAHFPVALLEKKAK